MISNSAIVIGIVTKATELMDASSLGCGPLPLRYFPWRWFMSAGQMGAFVSNYKRALAVGKNVIIKVSVVHLVTHEFGLSLLQCHLIYIN